MFHFEERLEKHWSNALRSLWLLKKQYKRVGTADLPVVDVCLTTVDDSYDAEPHWDDSATQYIDSICSMVHEIKLRNHCQRSSTWSIA